MEKETIKRSILDTERELKIINIAIFGIGLVGGTLVDQLVESTKKIKVKHNLLLNVFAIGNSTRVYLNKNGNDKNWRINFNNNGLENYSISQVIHFAKEHQLQNLIAVDNTADKDFVENYINLVNANFNMVSSNKIANTISYSFYRELRLELFKNQKKYLYETNVGAGLPLIDTINLLHQSGENITKIRGVFSGSLSYLFNNFSSNEKQFSDILKEAIDKGYTEPDPREDLCGNDVARKLLILARELDLENEFEEIEVENLIPEDLRDVSKTSFLSNLELINDFFQQKKENQRENYVLKYVGELSGDLQQSKGNLKVELKSISKNTTLGSLKDTDTIFEIYTDSYGDNPIIIQGAGAGSKVTARGVFGDILRLSKQIKA